MIVDLMTLWVSLALRNYSHLRPLFVSQRSHENTLASLQFVDSLLERDSLSLPPESDQ